MRGIALVEAEAEALQLGQHVRLPALVGHQHPAHVADRLRLHMLVGARVLQHRGGVDAGLGREGARADEGRVAVRLAVEDLVDLARHVGELAKRLVGDAEIETVGVSVLEFQRADQRHEIGVAAALAEAVERALDMARAGLDGRERIGDRAAAIVMGVDAEMRARHDLGDLGDDRLPLHAAAFRRSCRIARPSARRPRRPSWRRRAHNRGLAL